MREAEVGSILKKYRLLKGITEDELAQLLGIWNRYVPLWEEGLALPDAHLQQLLVEILRIPAPEADVVLQPKTVLNFDEAEIVIPGLEKEYTLLHLSDNHVIMVDYNDTPERIRYEERRISADFYEDSVMINDRMEATWQYIEENKDTLDGVLMTGDVIDCPFDTAIEYLLEKWWWVFLLLGVFVILLIATFFIPIIGIVMGAMNLKYPERNGQSVGLLSLGVIMALANFGVIMGAMG